MNVIRLSLSVAIAALAIVSSALPPPQYLLAFDGDATWSGRDGANVKPAIVHGGAKWSQGVSGKALLVSRHAYDQVTAVVSDVRPNGSTRHGTLAFWFRPTWDQLDGEKHYIFGSHSDKWRPFRIYMIKSPNGQLDVSFVESKQVQFIQKDVFKKNTWTHIALTWDATDGKVCIYQDGKLRAQKAAPAAFNIPDETVSFLLECGDGTDRFKATVGDGLYDDLRIYDSALSADDVFILATNSDSAPMRAVAPPAGNSFLFSYSESSLSSSTPLLRFATAGGAKFTLTAMGASRMVSLIGTTEGASSVVAGADTLDLRTGYDMSFASQGRTLAFLVDGAEQGRIELDRDIGRIVAVEAADGVTIQPPRRRKPERPAKASAAEAALWSPTDATRRKNGVRSAVSLNGYWRVWPVEDYTGEPPADEPGYMRVPGSFRSPLWNLHRIDKASGTLDAGTHSWRGHDLEHYRAAWYERAIPITPKRGDADGQRTWIVFDHFNVDVGRIYWNGALVKAFRQDFKSFTMVPNRIRVDVTDRLAPDGRNVLRLYADRHCTGLWQGKPSIGDHGEICLGDVWLERTPDRMTIATALAIPKWRFSKTVTVRARISNPGRETGAATLKAEFTRPGDATKTCETTVELTGEPEQVVTWTEPWPDAVAWSAEAPQTYSLDVSLSRSGRVADTFPTQLFGFREAWVENGEFWLNGEHLRLRMWTCPALGRLRYYYGHPEAVEQYVAHIKELNYDTVRNDPWGKRSIVGRFEYFDACDRMGVYNLHQMPAYEDEPRAIYDTEVERFFEVYGGHPSILMWYTDFNTCGYSWGQDPAKLTDDTYEPPSKRVARRRARIAEETMRSLDPSRELFQHAGGNSGKIFGSMNYQSYGTPLQEQEDWPAQWAKGHRQPLMSVESAFPYPWQFQRFDKGGSQEHLGAEQAARYFGPSAFAVERFPVPHSANMLWAVDVATGEDPNMLRLSDLQYRRVVPAWRGYGVSAIGDFPGGRDHTRTIQMFNDHLVVWSTGGNPKTPGLKPEVTAPNSEVQRHLLGDYSRPDYLHATVKACFAPLLVFAGGDPSDFTNKDHLFFAGETFRKSLVVVNDHLHPVSIEYEWTCAEQSGKGKISVPAGGIVREPIPLKASDVSKKTDAALSVEWRSPGPPNGTPTSGHDTIALRFFPKRTAPEQRPANVTLYDPLGKTASLLRRAGLEFETVASLDALPPTDLLIVGQGAFAASPLKGDLPAAAANAIVFEQPTNALARFVMSAPSCRDAFTTRPGSPYLAGLDDKDLADWRGASDTVPAFVLSDEHSPHYPRSKWKCGNGGIVSGCAIRRPSRGNFRTIVSCGFNLENAALLEERRARGRTIWCQMDVTSRYGKDPAATRLVDNLLAEFKTQNPNSEFRNQKPAVYYLGSNKDAETLALAGADLKAWDGSAKGTVLVLPGADLLRLPFRYTRGKTLDFRATVPDDPAFAGVSQADLYFRNANELPTPAFDVRREGATTFVFLGLAPDGSVKGLWNDEKILRIWSTVLDNLGVRLAPETPYIPDLDTYDGDAFHNW